MGSASYHISVSALGSISWTDVTPNDPDNTQPWMALAVNADASLFAASDGASFFTSAGIPTSSSSWTDLTGKAPGALSVAISDTATLGAGPGINFAGLSPTFQTVTAAGAQYNFASPPHRVQSADNTPLSTLITQNGQTYGVDPDTFARQLFQESEFDPNIEAANGDGGKGIAQWTRPYPPGYNINPWDPSNSIQNAGAYINSFLNMFFNNIGLALAAYNAGAGTVSNYLAGGAAPNAITQAYVLAITGRTIAEWAAKGYKAIASDAGTSNVDVSGNSGGNWIAQSPAPGSLPMASVAISGVGADAVAAAGSAMWTTRSLGPGG